VMHFAAYAYVGESVQTPDKYYRNNVVGTLTLLEAMQAAGIKQFVFSSTCATYGNPQQIPITEDHPQNPINPYGATKLMVERILQDFDVAYGQWEGYFAWVDAQSRRVSSSVGASQEEIFKTTRALATKGMVATTEQQMDAVGKLVDFIKAATGVDKINDFKQIQSQLDQLWKGGGKDETAGRPGSLLGKMMQIDPEFKTKMREAVEESKAIGNAQPLWDLFQETIAKTGTMSEKLAMQFSKVVEDAKSGIDMLLREAFTPFYNEIVGTGKALVETFYSHGRLTETGIAVAAGLSQAWTVVRGKVQEFIVYLTNNGPEVAKTIGNIAKSLGNVVLMAGEVASAFLTMVNAGSNLSGIEKALGALVVMLAGLRFGIFGAIAAFGLLAGAAIVDMKRVQNAKENIDNTVLLNKYAPGQVKEAETEKSEGINIIPESLRPKVSSTTEQDKAKLLRDVAIPKMQEDMQYLAQKKLSRPIDTETEKIEMERARIAEDQRKLQGNYKGALPTTKPVTPAPPSGAEKKPDVKEQNADIALRRALREEELAKAEAAFKQLKEADSKHMAELKAQLADGTLSYEDYYNKIRAMDLNEANESIEILKQKKTIAVEAQNAIIADIDVKVAKGAIDEYTGHLMKLTEMSKARAIALRAQSEIDTEILKKEKQLYDVNRLQTEEQKKMRETVLKYEKSSSWGPLAQENAAVAEMRNKARDDMRGGSADDIRRITAAANMKEIEIRYKTEIDGFVNAITGGITNLIDGIMAGKASMKDISKTLNTMFSGIFKSSLEQGMKQLTQYLTDAFTKMFQDLGPSIASAAMGAIAIIGMMLTKQTSSSYSASGAKSAVTAHEAVRGVIAGDTSLPIAQIGTSLHDALVTTNGILNQIEYNTRRMGSMQLNLTLDIPGIKDAVAQAMTKYFADMAQTMGK